MTLTHELTRTYTMSALVAFSVLVLVPILSREYGVCVLVQSTFIYVSVSGAAANDVGSLIHEHNTLNENL